MKIGINYQVENGLLVAPDLVFAELKVMNLLMGRLDSKQYIL